MKVKIKGENWSVLIIIDCNGRGKLGGGYFSSRCLVDVVSWWYQQNIIENVKKKQKATFNLLFPLYNVCTSQSHRTTYPYYKNISLNVLLSGNLENSYSNIANYFSFAQFGIVRRKSKLIKKIQGENIVRGVHQSGYNNLVTF